MTIEINEKSYIVGIWFSSNPITENNWLAGVVRDPENPKRYKGWSRFRYVKDDKIFDSEDEKKWTDFTSQEHHTEQDMIDFMDLAQVRIEEGYPDKDKIIVKGDIKKLVELSKGKEWMNIKQVPAEEYNNE